MSFTRKTTDGQGGVEEGVSVMLTGDIWKSDTELETSRTKSTALVFEGNESVPCQSVHMEFKSNFFIIELLRKLETEKLRATEHSNSKHTTHFHIKHNYTTGQK